MSKVARICEATQQRGNALVLLILLKTWDGSELPTHYELAKLANISPRQAERDLQKLIDDGAAERVAPEVKGRGHVTRFRHKESPSHVSDKSTSDVTDFKAQQISPSHPSDIPETTSHLTDLSDVNPVTSDAIPAANYVTSDGTKLAPSKARRTSTDTPQPTVEGGAHAPPPAGKKKPTSSLSKLPEPEQVILELWRELAKAYPPEYAWPTIFERVLDGFDAARFKRCGGAYLTHFGKGQRYVGGILDWYERNQTEPERSGNGKVAAGRFGKPEVTRDFSRFPRRTG